MEPTTREGILEALRAGTRRSVIARRFNVSHSGVGSIARAAGIARRPQTVGQKKAQAAATEQLKLDARERRARISLALLEDADKLRRRLWEPAKAFDFGGKDFGYVEHEISEPDARSKQALAIAMAVCLDKSIALERFDSEGSTAVRAAIIELVDRLAGEETRISLAES